jgi:hypothetical protein
MISSMHFGMTFWLDSNNDFCYCPTFNDNTPDKDNWNYVTEWVEFDSTDLDKLFYIHRHLVTQKAQQLQEVV